MLPLKVSLKVSPAKELIMNERTGYVYYDREKKKWIARVTYVLPSGKKRNIRRQVLSKTDGKNLLKKILRELEERPDSIEGDRMTFRQLAAKYLERRLQPALYQGEIKVSGMRDHRTARQRLKVLLEHFGNRRIRSITHSDLERYRAMRFAEPVKGLRKDKNGKLKLVVIRDRSVATINRELQLLRACFNFALRQGWLMRTPFHGGDSLISSASERKRDRLLSLDEEARLLAACEGPRTHLRPILIAALDTAMRQGELLKLRWEDVDLASGLIIIRALNSKTLKARTVGMTTRLRAELERLFKMAPPDSSGLVFGIKSNVKSSFASACRVAKIDGLRFHDLRHVATSRMVMGQKLSPLEVMAITGHSQMQTFLRYVNVDQHTAKRGAEALDDLREEMEEAGNSGFVN
jgi:integrase